MVLLDILTPEIIAERFYTLPEELQNALENKDNQRAVQMVLVKNGVADLEEVKNAEAIVAAVMLGLTHMDDLKATFVENLLLDPQSAEKIATEIRANVLEPFRKGIEEIYSPIKSGNASDVPVPVVPAPALMKSAAPAPSPTPSYADVLKMPAASTRPAAMPSAPAKSWQPTKLNVAAATSAPVPQPTKPPTSAQAPAPFMMHKETSATPLVSETGFKLNVPSSMFKSPQAVKVDIPRPPKAANLEIGKAPVPPKAPGSVSFRAAPAPQSRVVHYTDLRTGISSGIAAAQPRAMPTPKAVSMPAAKPAPTTPPPMTKPPMPKPPAPIAAPAPIITPAPAVRPSSASTAPLPPKPPKVVNFGPEEVK